MIFELTEELKIISEINDHVKNIIQKDKTKNVVKKLVLFFDKK